MREQVTIVDRKKQSAEGTAEIVRYSSSKRLGTALPVAIGGTILGLGTIVIPGLHFVTTWLVPLLSIGSAWYLYNRRGECSSVQTQCPSCSERIDAEGGAWEDPMWVRCPACGVPLQVKLTTPMQ